MKKRKHWNCKLVCLVRKFLNKNVVFCFRTVDEARNTINSLGMSDTELTNLKMKAAQLESDLLKFEVTTNAIGKYFICFEIFKLLFLETTSVVKRFQI